jgi:hypothetical protein
MGAADAHIGSRLRHLMKYPDTRHFLSLSSIGVIVSPCIVQDAAEGSSQGGVPARRSASAWDFLNFLTD